MSLARTLLGWCPMKQLRSLSVVFVLALGCGGGSASSGSSAPLAPPPEGAEGTLPDDPVRAELRAILTPCQRSMARLESQESRGPSRGRRVAAALATILGQAAYYLANQQGGGNSATGQPWRAERCTGATADDPECSSFATGPVIGGGPLGGAEDDPGRGDSDSGSAAVQDALAAVDEILDRHAPSSAEWDEREWGHWRVARTELRRACQVVADAASD
jgi:hypothetical protein